MPRETQPASVPKVNKDSAGSRRQRDGGYLLVAILFLLALMVITLTVEAPRMVQQIKRDREEEMIRRGTEYARAIKKYYKKFGRYPANLDQLDNTNQIRFLRKHYKDPLTKDGKWKLLNYADIQSVLVSNGGVGVPAGALGSQAGQTLGQPASGFGNSPFGGTSAIGQQQQQQAVNSNGIFSNGQQQTTSGINVANSGQSNSGDSTQGNAGQGSNGQGTSPFTNTFSLGSSSSSSGGSGNNGTTQGTVGGGLSTPTTNGGAGSPFGNSANQSFGGAAIVGVASVDKHPTIRIYNKKKTYNEWMFIYDPTQDRNNVLLRGPYQPQTLGGASGQNMNGSTPAGQINGQQTPFGQQSGSGFGQPSNGYGQGSSGTAQPQQPQQPQQ